MFNILHGHLRQKELWYQVQDAGLLGPDRTLLYRANAPELAIVKKMWWYADFAQKWFQKRYSYPTDADKCKAADSSFEYLNPFTFHRECAAIVSLKGLTGDPSWSERPREGLSSPHWRAGGIHCICVDGTKFYVHGCDRFGIPLTASDPTHYFVIDCINGRNRTREKLSREDSAPMTSFADSDLKVFICSRPEQEASIRAFRFGTCLTAWVLMILSTIWCWLNQKFKKPLGLKIAGFSLAVLSFCGLAGWYFLAYSL